MTPTTNEEETWDQCFGSLLGELKNKIIDAINAMPKMSTTQIQYNFSVVISRRLDQITISLDFANLERIMPQEGLFESSIADIYKAIMGLAENFRKFSETHIHIYGGNLMLSGNPVLTGDIIENGGTKIIKSIQ